MATFDVGIIVTAINNAKGAFRGVRNDLEKTEKAANRTAKRMRAIQVVLVAIAVGAAVQFAKGIANTVGEMELLISRLSAVEGGLSAARATLKNITAEFAQTPFSIDAVANSFTRLRAAGLSTEDANATLRAGVDAVAAFGGSTAELNRFIIGLQQSIGKGTLSMEELRQQIGEAVPSAMRVLAREMDISIGELFTRIERGSVESLEAVKLLTRGLQKDFGGFANSLGDKITGALKGAQSRIRIALEELFNVDTDAGAQTVELIRDMEKAITGFIKSISQDEIDRLFLSIKNGAAFAGNLVSVLRTVVNVLGDLFNGINALLGQSGTFIAAGGLIGYLMFGKVGAAAGLILTSIQQVFGSFMSKAQGANSFVGGLIGTFGNALTFGMIGYLIFGKAGPAGIIAAIGTIFTKIGEIASENRAQEALVANLASRVARKVGDGGTEAARKFLKALMAEAERNSGIGSTFARTVLGRQGSFEEGLKKIRQLLVDLQDPTSEFFKLINRQSTKSQKKMETLTQLVTRSFAQTAVKIRKLVDQAETTTFSFGGQSAEKLRRKLEPMVAIVEQLRKKIAAFEKAAVGRTLTSQEQKALAQARKELSAVDKDIRRINEAISTGEAKGVAAFADKVNDAFKKAQLATNRFAKSLSGNDGLDGKIQAVRDQYEQIKLKIDEVIERQKKLGDSSGIAKSNAELQRAADIRDKLIAKLEREKQLQDQLFAIQQASARMQIGGDIARLAREQRGGIQAVFQSSFADQADDRKLQLKQGILAAQERIKALEIEAQTASAARAAEIEATSAKLQEYVSAQQAALESTSAAGMLAKSTWQEVGDAISSSTKDALKDVVKGTFDAEKALLAFYDKLTDAAINYLVELVKIQIQQQLLGAASGGGAGAGAGGAGIFGALFSGLFAANGAIARGGIKAFANGDIIRGPTMFGLAGEAGDEAIMPLTRVGGQLGVRAEGGAGDQYHITIQAIDAQSSAEFIRKHGDAFVSTIKAKGRLNNGIGSTR